MCKKIFETDRKYIHSLKNLEFFVDLELVGNGNFSTIHKGRDINTGEVSAIKIMSK